MTREARVRQVVLADFLGAWRLDREVVHADGLRARLLGRAVWTPRGAEALYVESGQLTIEGQGSFEAERRYLWSADLEVFFEDGRFFHRVPGAGVAAGHWCAPDQYDVSYDFSGWPLWSCRWQVTGPRKDYCMRSRYLRER